MCRTIKILILNGSRTRKFCQLLRAGKTVWLFSTWSRVGHPLRPIFMLWLVKIWQVSSGGKFMLSLETCLLWQLKLTEFVSTCDDFNCLFPLDVQNEIQLLSSRVFCYSWLVCLSGIWLRNTSLVKGGMALFSFFTLLDAICLRGLKSLKRFWAYLIAFRSCISNGKPE